MLMYTLNLKCLNMYGLLVYFSTFTCEGEVLFRIRSEHHHQNGNIHTILLPLITSIFLRKMSNYTNNNLHSKLVNNDNKKGTIHFFQITRHKLAN